MTGDDREWVPDDEVTCLYCQRYKNRAACRCGNPNPPRRPEHVHGDACRLGAEGCPDRLS